MDRNKIAFIICLALGIVAINLYLATPQTKPDLILENKETRLNNTLPIKKNNSIKVQISGAVKNPGVYEVNKGSRVEELVFIAGGMTESADKDKANMVRTLRDGSLISIPHKKQNKITSSTSKNSATIDPQSATITVNINSADQNTLQQIKGIGPVLAERIIAYRQTHGRFSSKQDLLNVPGIGTKLLDKVNNQIKVD